MVENRRHQRTTVDIPVEFSERGSTERFEGQVRDISLGGVLIETENPLAFSSGIEIYLAFGPRRVAMVFPGVVRWAHAASMGVQFGLLGARETHAITELSRR